MRITEKTSVSLSMAWTILCVVVTGVFGGAVWATKVDFNIAALKEDMVSIKTKLGIETASIPSPHPGPTPMYIPMGIKDAQAGEK